MARLAAVSLFSNCGAGDVGYAGAGFRFDVMAELVPHRLKVALLNHPGAVGVVGDLRETLPRAVGEWRRRHGEARPALLAACPPCQGMSSARSGLGRENDADASGRDPRNLLVLTVAQAVRDLRPRCVVVENVPAFFRRRVQVSADGAPVSAAGLLIGLLADDYAVFPMLAELADFGVPQSRRRSFLTFVRRDESATTALRDYQLAPFPARTHVEAHVTASEALTAMKLPSLDAAEEGSAQDPDRPLHAVPVWIDRRYAMVEAIPAHSGRSAWQNDSCSTCGSVPVGPEDAACPRCGEMLLRPAVRDEHGLRLVKGFRTSSYARIRSDRPAATITTASGHVGSDKTIHPWENRLLSTLECALLQTFPVDFRWGDALKIKGHTNVREMIGEAVPPMFTRQHGRVLASLLEGRRPYRMLKANDASVVKACKLLGVGTNHVDPCDGISALWADRVRAGNHAGLLTCTDLATRQ